MSLSTSRRQKVHRVCGPIRGVAKGVLALVLCACTAHTSSPAAQPTMRSDNPQCGWYAGMTLPDDRLNLPAAGPLQGMPDNLHPVSINPLLPDNVAAATLRASKAVEQANIEYNKGHIRQAHTL